jgi:hypothetical protein
MISVAPDVLSRLLALRHTEGEDLGKVLRRLVGGAANTVAKPPAQAVIGTSLAKGASVRYQLLGETHTAVDATEALINILSDLAQYDNGFFAKLAVRVRGRTRNHLARSRSEVYPERPDLARYAKEVAPGWFIGCNIANREKEKILRAACEVMGLAFGRDLKIDLPHA